MVHLMKHFVLLLVSLIVISWSGWIAMSPCLNFVCQRSHCQQQQPFEHQIVSLGMTLRIADIFVDENNGTVALPADLSKLVCRDFVFLCRSYDNDTMKGLAPFIPVDEAGRGIVDKYLSDYYTIGLLKIVI